MMRIYPAESFLKKSLQMYSILCIWRLSTSHPNCPYHKLLHKIRFFLSPLVWHAAGGREETIYCFAFYQIFGGMYLLTYPPTLKNPSLLSPLKNIISSKKVCYFCNSVDVKMEEKKPLQKLWGTTDDLDW